MFKRLKENVLFRFLIVGGLGALLNLFVFYILSDVFGINYNLSSIVAFSLAVTQNYFFNELWSFANVGNSRLSIKRYLIYLSGNLIGLLVNVGLLNLFLALFVWKLKLFPQAIAVGAATILNFTWAKIVVFKRSGDKKE